MIYVIDTNVILFSIINDKFETYYKNTYRQKGNELVISAVVEGELKALALKRKWGEDKINQLSSTLEHYITYPVKTAEVINTYAQIDAYSQGKLAGKPLPKKMSSRNMGKNDIWIAATTYINNATLVTTDKDFDHLDKVYFKRDLLNIDGF